MFPIGALAEQKCAVNSSREHNVFVERCDGNQLTTCPRILGRPLVLRVAIKVEDFAVFVACEPAVVASVDNAKKLELGPRIVH